jgi:uncharacterized membrane protein required for colicin V production
MIAGFVWPDVVIAAILAVMTLKGFARGFVREIGGLVAIAALLIAPHFYNGAADQPIDSYRHLGAAGSHLAGMLLTGIFAYVVVLVLAWILNRIARLPVLGLANAFAGAVLGFVKAALIVGIVLFIALFFPLTPAIRGALHASALAPYFVSFDGALDAAMESAIPAFVKPLVDPYFERHHL